jgi:hypothetical protein
MSTEMISRISRSDSLGDYVLVNVTSNGASQLDLKLIATEGEAPYVGSGKPAGSEPLIVSFAILCLTSVC